MFLQLAESGKKTYPVKGYYRPSTHVAPHRRHYMNEAPANADNPFVFIPDTTGQTKGYYIREDYLDHLTTDEYNKLMNHIAPYQPQVRGGQMSEHRFLSDRASRKANRQAKREAKTDKRKAKNELIRARAEQKKSGKGKTGGEIFSNILDTAGKIFGKGGGAPDAGGGAPDQAPTPTPTPEKKSFFKTPVGIAAAAGIGLVVLVGGAKLLKGKKRKKK